LGADFNLAAFEHVALWDAEHEWIEMRLRSRTEQTVKIPALDLAVDFAAGEDLRTEISAKFREDGVQRELSAAGFDLTRWFTSPGQLYGLALATTAQPAPSLRPAAARITVCVR
ncbi:L-histidine N(alpha)-methyltransferase, partial [Streptomyces sp. NPDC048489]|uniref:L-histidine N(alpha)-methyltransferase n=1 Tax=Streptomyces sp. NPDC048489 TaxID=3154504 RepID=UPI003418ACCF